MQFRGQLAGVVAERLRPVVDDVVDLSAPAPVEGVGGRTGDVADLDPGQQSGAGHRGHRPPLRESGEQLVVRHTRTVENAVAQHDSLGVAVLAGRQHGLFHTAQRRQHLRPTSRRRPGIRVGLVHQRRAGRGITVGEDHRLGDHPAHAGALRRGHQVRGTAAPQFRRGLKVLEPLRSPLRQCGQQADDHLGRELAQHRVELGGVEHVGHHRLGAGASMALVLSDERVSPTTS